jgi:dipeptidyl aminopeptidase/acylaminoacyl peptidase
MKLHIYLFTCCVMIFSTSRLPGADPALTQPDDKLFGMMDVFGLEYASDPQISPDGKQIVYVRNFMDIMKDKQRSNLWIVNTDGSDHRPITSGNQKESLPRWSLDGKRLLYVSSINGSAQLYVRWMDTGQTAKLTNLITTPSGISWSPDGRNIAFSMRVPQKNEPFVKLPPKPEGAEWAEPAKVIRKLNYRSDGKGFLKDGYHHLFVLPAEGRTPRQLTSGKFHHNGSPSWSADSKSLIFSANRRDDWEYEPRNDEIYELSLKDREIHPLTDRVGPDENPVVSPDGEQIAYLGFDDKRESYQITRLYVMNRDGSDPRAITADVDRSVRAPRWSQDGRGLFFLFDNLGDTQIGFVSLADKPTTVAKKVGGTVLGRPYAGGSFSVSHNGTVAFTQTGFTSPADVAVVGTGIENSRQITSLNDDLLAHKTLATVEEIQYSSSHDGRKIQGWIVKPPGFDPDTKYPFILEIHGGPFANYGPRFAAEIQLYATAGYVVFYANPRGSTGYGKEFGNLIHHAYPGHDYDDLMSGVDTVIQKGYIDEENLFVTGGSGGGVLTSWIVGKTGRFRAAVAAKPVINWYSFVLTSDGYPYFTKYWFPGFPWDHPEHYMKRSPLSLVGNVTTPTMLLTGEVDYRTPMSESEQFYQALKLRKIDTVLVRIPGASHAIVARPSRMIVKVSHILKWFEMHKKSDSPH